MNLATRDRFQGVLTKHWPLWVGWAFSLGLTAWLFTAQLAATGGNLIYPSDDAYLRLAIARNLATHATWGLNPGEFASVSGSIAWPLLNAILVLILGAQVWIPLALNLALSLLCVALAYRIVSKVSDVSWFKASALVLLAIALPLAPLVTGGLEHVLQLVLCLLFAERLMDHLGVPQRGDLAVLALLGAGLSVTRYEGLLVVFVACLILAAHREIRLSLALGILSVLPVAIYALISVRHGWLPVPNTVYFRRAPLFPSTWRERFGVLTRFFDVIDQAPDLRAMVLIPMLGLVWRSVQGRVRSVWDREFAGVALFLLTAILHFTLIGNPNDRYDAYIILLGWWAALPLLGGILQETTLSRGSGQFVPGAITALLGLVLLFPLVSRGITDSMKTPTEARNVFEQEYQAAQLAQTCSADQPVASDKVGLIAYRGSRVLDLSGFGTMAVARARRSQGIKPNLIQGLASGAGVQLAIVNDLGLKTAIPANWQGLGSWTIHDCVACAETGLGGLNSDYMFLYATSEATLDSLRPCLASFSASMPSGVIQTPGQ